MATQGEAETEYESDPEDVPLPSMRRREASDDEDGEREGSVGPGRPLRKDLRAGVGSDGESDGQGGAQVYDEEEDEDEEYYDDEEDEFGDEEGFVEGDMEGEGIGEREGEEVVEGEGRHDGPGLVGEAQESGVNMANHQSNDEGEGEEKKENEPYAVPTSGAFYMHDDRFQENGRGRNRRMFGGRKLWDPKDERAWVHDRFEEMNLQDVHVDEERRRPKGRFRGRGGGRGRGSDRGGYVRGGRSHKYHDDGNDQNRVPRTVRGRGPRRYESLATSNREIPGSRRKVSPAKPQEITSHASTVRQTSLAANAQPDLALPRKYAFASSLNSASPPFYPSGSSNQDILTHKKDSQAGNANKLQSNPLQAEDNSLASQSSSLLRRKAVINPVAQDKMYGDTIRSVAGKGLGSSYTQSSGFSLSANAVQTSNSRIQGRGLSTGGPSPSNQVASSLGHVGRGSLQGQTPIFEQRPMQGPIQPALRGSTQQLVQHPGGENQASPPHLTDEVGETGSPPGSSKSKTSLVGKGKTNNQGMGRGSFLYGGAQVIGATGAMGLAHGDQNFPGTPALLPVMHFGGQHPGGLGVPAVGMALPGYVAQPQLGFGNSEMAWVPVLAGAAGALGASYCSPYIALDENYYARPTGQSSSSISARETGTSKPASSLKPSQRPDVTNDELAQRQNKPRRYSEMSFGQ